MTDTPNPEAEWRLGKLYGAAEGAVDLRRWRAVSDEEAEQLQASSRLVSNLASQRDFRGLVDAVGRWVETVERIGTRLAAGQTLPRSVLTMAALDLAAISHAADRCEQNIVSIARMLEAEDLANAEHMGAIEAARRFLQTRRGFLACSALTPDARAGRIEFNLVDSAVHVAGLAAFDAADFGRVVLGEVGGFMVSSVAALADACAEPVRQLVALLEDVPDGVMPDLARLRGADRPSGVDFASLAIRPAVALRRFSDHVGTVPPVELHRELLLVINANTQQQIAIGPIEVSSSSEASRVNTAVDELPHISFTLDVDLLGSAPVDFWGRVTLDMSEDGVGRRLFAGAVQDASGPQPLAIFCEGGVELTEHNRGGIAAVGVNPAEMVATIMRQIGLHEDTITLSSREQQPRTQERFEVFVPIRGLSVTEPAKVGRITLVPNADGQQPLGAFDVIGEHFPSLTDEYRTATAYAVAAVEADSLDVAEELGYSEVETAISWLVTRQRYGLLRLPDGTPQTFSRTEALQSVRYAPVALARGLTTGRQWLRWVQDVGDSAATALSAESDLLQPAMPEDLDPADERALRALMRAANEPGLQQQVQALSEALENYVAAVEVPTLFSKTQLRELRGLAPEWFDDRQKDKFEKTIGGLNGAPFGVKLSERLDRDGVPLTEEERTLLLGKLRAARNDVAHGKQIEQPPTRDEVLRGIGIVSRALMFGVAARARADEPSPS